MRSLLRLLGSTRQLTPYYVGILLSSVLITATALSVHAPGAAMEAFAHAAAALAAEGAPGLDDVLALAARHGIEVTGPIPDPDR